MKGDWLAIGIQIVLASLMFQAVGLPVMPWVVSAVGTWVAAVPHPTEHFASIIGSLAWPLAILVMCWIFSEQLSIASHLLARRFADDDVELAGFLKLKRVSSLAVLDKSAPAVGEILSERLRVTHGLEELSSANGSPEMQLDDAALKGSSELAAANQGSEKSEDEAVIEALLEFAGESEANAAEVLNWISTNLGFISDPEVFLNAKGLAAMRAQALREMKG